MGRLHLCATGAVCLGLASAAPVSAAVLYGAAGNELASDLYRVNPETGMATSIGPIGEGVTGLAVHPATRVLYAVTSANSPTTPRALFTIDPATGDSTLVGALGIPDSAVADISFADDGTLFGWSENTDDLVTIDLGTGTATVVGDSELDTAGSGLAFHAAGTLFFAGAFDPGSPALTTIDPATGFVDGPIVAFTGLQGGDQGRVGALAFHPETEVLYGVGKVANALGSGLVTINPTTAAAALVGPVPDRFDAIAFGPACGDGELDAPWEECDDGNTEIGDGCSAECQIGLCPAEAAEGCIAALKGSLSIDERRPGKEKLKATLSRFLNAPAPPASLFGDPVDGTTEVDLCIYDDKDALVAELPVPRAGDSCVKMDRPCWKEVGIHGYAYNDPPGFASGVRKISMKSGAGAKSKLAVSAGNKASAGQAELPTGLAAALQGEAAPRLQILTSDAECFGLILQDVKKSDGQVFKVTGTLDPL